MKRLYQGILCVCCFLISGCGITESPIVKPGQSIAEMPTSRDMKYTIPAIQQFMKDTLPHVLQLQENSCYSPSSFYIALAMLASGTTGTVQDQLVTALHRDGITSLTDDLQSFIASLQNSTAINITQSLWLHADYQTSTEWNDMLQNQFMASVHPIDFRQSNAHNQIKNWIAKETNNLLHPDLVLPQETILLLLNTIYLNLEWQTAFSTDKTYEDTFYLADGTTKKVSFMHNDVKQIPYYNKESYRAIQMPLQDDNNLYFILPNDGYTLESVIQDDWLADINNEDVTSLTITLSMPKFSYDYNINFIQACMNLGLQEIFEGIQMKLVPPTPLSVDQIEQNTHIKIDEKGVEAAAETHISMVKGMVENPNQINFDLNQPFFYVLTTKEKIPLFIGTVQNP